MAVNEIEIEAPPARVFEVLANAPSYSDWVVGATRIRAVEGPWPAAGATFHHTQGIAGVGLKDTTTVRESVDGSRLAMEVRVRPMLIGIVEFDLAAEGGGTRVTMTETPMQGVAKRLVPDAAIHAAIKFRNAETLRRLKKLAEQRPG